MFKYMRPITLKGFSNPIIPGGKYPTFKRAKVKALDYAGVSRKNIKEKIGISRYI